MISKMPAKASIAPSTIAAVGDWPLPSAAIAACTIATPRPDSTTIPATTPPASARYVHPPSHRPAHTRLDTSAAIASANRTRKRTWYL
jgi:hypothetical protein